MISIHELLIQFVYNHKIKAFFYILFTVISYPLQNIYIPDYYGKVINSFKDKDKSFVWYVQVLCSIFAISCPPHHPHENHRPHEYSQIHESSMTFFLHLLLMTLLNRIIFYIKCFWYLFFKCLHFNYYPDFF